MDLNILFSYIIMFASLSNTSKDKAKWRKQTVFLTPQLLYFLCLYPVSLTFIKQFFEQSLVPLL